jgi:phenylacetate-CoA ligase
VNWRLRAYRLAPGARGDRWPEALDESERWSPAVLRAAQEARLRALLLHAFEHVPYYRPMLLERGVVAEGRSLRVDLSRLGTLPPLTRATVRERLADLRDPRPRQRGDRRFWVQSGGTTGEPSRVLWDRATHRAEIAVRLWFDRWTGYTFGEPKVILWGALGRSLTARARLRRAVRDWLKHEIRVSHYERSEAWVRRSVELINRVRPAQVLGWAGIVDEVARGAERLGLSVAPPGAVMVSAEALRPEMRARIERVFAAPVFDRYGCQEVGGVACECRVREGLHVASPTLYVEVVRPDGRPAEPGEVGEILITPLTHYAMPLLRYRIGDLGAMSPEPCGCGRPFPRLTRLLGRTLDSLVRPDGTLVHGVYVNRFYHRMPWIERFQVVQRTPIQVHVRLVDAERAAEPLVRRRHDLAAITAHLRETLDDRCEVSFEFLEDIPPEASGKHRATVSLVPR